MSEEEEMDTSDTPWFWYYLADCGRWHRFEVSRLQLGNFFFFFHNHFTIKTSQKMIQEVCVRPAGGPQQPHQE